MSLFSPEEGQQVLDRLLAALQDDHRIAGVLIVGSGAVGLETKHFRQVDEMPEDRLGELEQALPSTDPADVVRALQVATTCFFHEAAGLDQTLGLDAARGWHTGCRRTLICPHRPPGRSDHD